MRHVVRISDGLGNQMFQYAFAYALYRETGDEVLIDPFFWGTSLRKYQLDIFDISLSKRFISPFKDYILGFGPRNGRKFKEKYRLYLADKYYEQITEQGQMIYDPHMLNPKTSTFYLGFWQNPRYFDTFYDDIKRQFCYNKALSEKCKNYKEMIEGDISVALHIRRTDYVREVGDATLGLSFYKSALEELDDKLGNYKLYIFSDDKDYVSNNFTLKDYVLIQNVSDTEEFELMRMCDHHIIANSTFSWWAAYLGANKGGIVYAPRTAIWSNDFYYDNWNLIDTETAQGTLLRS